MSTANAIDPLTVKRESERIILTSGGRICDWLPTLAVTEGRDQNSIARRALVMHALINLYFKAPAPIIARWIGENSLAQDLSPHEQTLLSKRRDSLSDEELTGLYWYIEGLWALLWVGGLTNELPFDQPAVAHTASLCPNIQKNESCASFLQRMRLRPFHEVFQMLDLYYRLHWYARDGQLNGYTSGNVSLDIVMERRKALEWVTDRQAEWDEIDLST